jgi:heme O synthase-like polyprenyltransferase
MSLLLLTGICGMVAGAHGLPSPSTSVALVIGLGFACGGASALNHVLDRDIDRLMGKRTAARPVAAGRLSAQRAVVFGATLSALSFVLLATAANLLAAWLALAGGVFYVLVYTTGSSARRLRTSSSAEPPALSRPSSVGRPPREASRCPRSCSSCSRGPRLTSGRSRS